MIFAASLLIALGTAATAPEYPPLPGWLGFSAAEVGRPKRFAFSPETRFGTVAILETGAEDGPLSALAGWRNERSGVRVRLIGSGKPADAAFTTVSKISYGCENMASAALFKAPITLAEGPTWIMPATSTENVTAVRVTKFVRRRNGASFAAGSQSWMFGEYSVTRVATSRTKGYLSVMRQSAGQIFREAYEAAAAGAEVLLPEPVAAFFFPTSNITALVVWRPHLEGNEFKVVALRPTSGRVLGMRGGRGDLDLYWCAF